MKHQILTVGLQDDLLYQCREHFAKINAEVQSALDISEAVSILKNKPVLLLVLDMKYLRNIGQCDWIANIRYVSYIPIIVLSDVLEADIIPSIQAGADICFDSKLSPSITVLLLSAQFRRYTEYDHYSRPETLPFQVGDIAIDPSRHIAWVRGRKVMLFPREFSLLLYFMHNPEIVLTQEQICLHAWKKDCPQCVFPAIHNLRKKIEPNPAKPIYIETIRRVGYRFTGYFSETCDN